MFRDNDKNTMRKFLFFKRFSSISQWVFNISESGVYSAEIGINDDRISGINITAEGQNTQLFIRLIIFVVGAWIQFWYFTDCNGSKGSFD